ncbi:MAG: PaaI family thioesterase [Burkholderiales bacterium]|nr:PaaI family thioesterase [Burkholderiales bacterium]
MNEIAARRAFDNAIETYEQDFGKFFLTRLFGMEFEYTDDECRITFELQDFMFNPRGGLHGGVIAFVMDISMGHLLYKRNGPGATLELKVQYLKVAKSGRLTCIGRFLRHGRSVSHLRSELLDENNELVAFATSTWKSLQSGKPAK